MWPFKKKRVPVVLPTPPAPAKTGTVILTLPQVLKLLPALQSFAPIAVSPEGIARIYDTALNSVVTPPAPWPQTLHRFVHIINLPADNGRFVTYFVFYPL